MVENQVVLIDRLRRHKSGPGPTSVRKRKLDSSEARGEPIPITLRPSATREARC